MTKPILNHITYTTYISTTCTYRYEKTWWKEWSRSFLIGIIEGQKTRIWRGEDKYFWIQSTRIRKGDCISSEVAYCPDVDESWVALFKYHFPATTQSVLDYSNETPDSYLSRGVNSFSVSTMKSRLSRSHEWTQKVTEHKKLADQPDCKWDTMQLLASELIQYSCLYILYFRI